MVMHRGQDLSKCNEFFRLQKQSATKNQRRILLKESVHVHVGPDFRRNPNKVFSDLNRKTKKKVGHCQKNKAAAILQMAAPMELN